MKNGLQGTKPELSVWERAGGRRLVIKMLTLKYLGHIPKGLHRKWLALLLQCSESGIRNTPRLRVITTSTILKQHQYEIWKGEYAE